MTAPNVQPSPTPPSTTPTTSTGAAPTGTEPPRIPAGTPQGGQFVNPMEYRYQASDGVPEYLVGKTPREAAQLVDGYYRLGQMNTAPAPNAPPVYQQPPTTTTRPTQDEWALNPYEANQRETAWRDQNVYQPAIQQTYQTNAQIARQMAELRHVDTFKRFGPEVDQLIRQMDPRSVTPAALDMAVDIVKGRHAHEIERERLQAEVDAEINRRMTTGSIVRPDTNGGTPNVPATNVDFTAEDIPESFKEACRKANLTPKDIDSFLLTTKYYGKKADGSVDLNAARKGYVEAMKRGAGGVITE